MKNDYTFMQNAKSIPQTGNNLAKQIKVFMLLFFLVLITRQVNAQFTPGNLIVEMVGDSSTSIASNNSAFPVNIREIKFSNGTTGKTWPVPTSTTDSTHRALTESGSAASDGHLTLSADARYVTITGYEAPLSTSGVVADATSTYHRVVDLISSTGTITCATHYQNAKTGAFWKGNVRAAYYDGTGIWLSGDDGNNPGTVSGLRYCTTLNGTTSNVSGVAMCGLKNCKGVYVYKGQLYVTSSSGSFNGVSSVGSGKPTSGTQTVTLLPLASGSTFPTTSYDAVMLDMNQTITGPDLLYLTNQATSALYKYYFDGTNWTAAGAVSLGTGTGSTVGGGMVASINTSDGSVDLYVVKGVGVAANSIVKYNDATGRTGTISSNTVTSLATATANCTFSGLSFAPSQTSAIASYSLSPANGATIAAGNYGNITIANGVTATLSGNITINGTLTVQNGGTLICGTNIVSSPAGSYGTFDLKSGGTIQIGSTAGITQYTNTGNIQTFSRFYNTGANYVYNGSSAQVTGDGLPATVNTFSLNNAAGLTLTGNITATAGDTITNGTLSLGGKTLTYGASAIIAYNGSVAQTTGFEWPNNLAKNVQINNSSATGVTLGSDISGYTGTITVGATGILNDGGFKITGTGGITFSSGATLITSNVNGVGSGSGSSNTGCIQLSGTVNYGSATNFTFNGTADQVTGTSMPATVKSITANLSTSALKLTLSQNTTVTTLIALNASHGTIHLGNKNLIVGSSASITGASSSAYIFTDGTGVLEMQAGTGGKLFPIGDSYNPINIATTSGTATFDVLVTNGATDASGVSVTDNAISRTWAISITSGSATIQVTPQWNTTDYAGAHFSTSTVFVASRTTSPSGTWTAGSQGTATALGGGDYNITSGNIAVTAGNTYYIGVGSGSTSPVPVTLVNFTATKCNHNAILNWSTASEQNNSHFEIEKSTDANTWNVLGQVEGHGNTINMQQYAYTDNMDGTLPSTIYYRLKQVDFNGKYTYSMIRSINFESFEDMVIYPNPASKIINLSFESVRDGQLLIKIADQSGNNLQSQNISITKGRIQVPVDISRLAKGNYVITIGSGATEKSYHFSKNE